MAPEYANIPVEPKTRDRLRAAKIGGETYDETVKRLLEESSGPQTGVEVATG